MRISEFHDLASTLESLANLYLSARVLAKTKNDEQLLTKIYDAAIRAGELLMVASVEVDNG